MLFVLSLIYINSIEAHRGKSLELDSEKIICRLLRNQPINLHRVEYTIHGQELLLPGIRMP